MFLNCYSCDRDLKPLVIEAEQQQKDSYSNLNRLNLIHYHVCFISYNLLEFILHEDSGSQHYKFLITK